MGTIRRQSIQATLVLGIGVLLGFVLKLFVFTTYLKPDEIGFLTVMLDAANLFAALIPLGSQSIFVKYLPHFRQKEQSAPRGLLLMGSILSLIGFLVFLLLFGLFKDQVIDFYREQAPLFGKYFLFLIPLVLFRVVFQLMQSYARALKRNVFPLIIKEIVVRLLTGILVISFAANYFDMDGLVLLFVAIYFISGAAMTWYISRQGLLNFSKFGGSLKNGKGKEILYFGLFAVLTSTGDILVKNVDSIMVTSLRGLAANGIYAIAFFIGQIIEMPRRALVQITAPFIAEASADQNQSKIASLYHKSSVNQFIVGSILLILVWTNIDNLFDLINNGDQYRSGKYVVLFIGLGKLFDMSMGVNGIIIQNSDHYRVNFYSTGLLGALVIVSNLVLIPPFGITGAALATLASIVGINIFKGLYLKLKLNLQPFNKQSFVALLIAGLAYLIAEFLPTLPSAFADLLYRSVVTLTIFVLMVLYFKVSDDFIDLFQVLARKLRKK